MGNGLPRLRLLSLLLLLLLLLLKKNVLLQLEVILHLGWIDYLCLDDIR